MDSSHVFINLNNVKVAFPFTPYKVQQDYMSKVIEAISGKHNAILESPTGTGKTLSLLCASLAWQQAQTSGTCMIYYTSRTHLQLSQAAKEMKRTAYARVPSVVIGSRAQMCLNDEVNKQPPGLINRSCRNAIAKNGCAYYTNYEQKIETMDQNIVHDIEDLHQFGRSHQCCPYYASKKLADSKASIVFMPYNYLLDTSIGKSTQLKLENSVIIFDEAHNIEGSLSDAASGSFKDSCLDAIQESCGKLPEKIHDALNREMHGLTRFGYDPESKKKKSAVVDEFAPKKDGKKKPEKEPKVNLIEELAEKLTSDKIRKISVCVEMLKNSAKKHMDIDKTCGIDKVYTVLEQASIHYTNSSEVLTTLESMISFWSVAGVMNVNQVSKYVAALSNLSHVISLLYPEECISVIKMSNHKKKLVKSYKAHLRGIYKDDSPVEDGTLIDWELNVWCLNPAIGLDRVIDSRCINGPRSLIITSGTLTPRTEVITALGRKFKICEGFEHVINENQLKVVLIGESPKNYVLKAIHKNTAKDQTLYYKELGETLLPTIKLLPYGTLVFFSSYTLMNRTMERWRLSKLWTLLTQTSQVFIESQSKEAFESDLAAYKRRIDSAGNNERAIFFGVCRGKLSEGVNLEGNHCRAVVIIGLPYPSAKDPKVEANIEYSKTSQDRQYWYEHQMRRALNQTIGRVIRSKNDYGMLILCDQRFIERRMSVSDWVRSYYPYELTPIIKAESVIKDFFIMHGIDIKQTSSISNLSSQPGAFEFDASAPKRPAPPKAIISAGPKSFLNGADTRPRSINNKVQSLGSLMLSSSPLIRNRPTTSVSPSAPSDASERLIVMAAAYTVDKDTLDKYRRKSVAEPPASKKPKTTADIFESVFSQPTTQASSNGSSAPPPLSAPDTQGTENYSILKQNENRPSKYKCFICLNEAFNPRATNCPCSRVACERCIRVLNNKPCGKCKTVIKKDKCKHRLFASSFSKRERLTKA